MPADLALFWSVIVTISMFVVFAFICQLINKYEQRLIEKRHIERLNSIKWCDIETRARKNYTVKE